MHWTEAWMEFLQLRFNISYSSALVNFGFVFLVNLYTVYTRVQVERVYKSNPIFEAKNTTFLEKVWFFSFHQLNKINRWSGIQG